MSEKFKFDVVIGNPPYQEEDGGAGSSSVPIYNKFMEEAVKLDPDYISFITPSKWFAGGKGLDNFRNYMLSSASLLIWKIMSMQKKYLIILQSVVELVFIFGVKNTKELLSLSVITMGIE